MGRRSSCRPPELLDDIVEVPREKLTIDAGLRPASPLTAPAEEATT
jgi:hypothetical protein